MSSSSTRYLPRFQLPELLERGRAEVVTCPVYRDGQLAAPTEAGSTLSVFDADGTVIVDAQPVTVTGGIARYVIAGITTSPLDFERNWRFEWSLLMPDGVVHSFRNDGALVKYRLYPVISDFDIFRRMRSFDTTLPGNITSRTNFQDPIDEADIEIQLRLLSLEKRPNLIATPTGLRQTWLNLAIAIVFEGLAGQNSAYTESAATWRDRYEEAFKTARNAFDYDEDGIVEGAERSAARPGAIWTC